MLAGKTVRYGVWENGRLLGPIKGYDAVVVIPRVRNAAAASSGEASEAKGFLPLVSAEYTLFESK